MAGGQQQEEDVTRLGNAAGGRVKDQRMDREQEGQPQPRRPRHAAIAKQLMELVDRARHEEGRDDAGGEPDLRESGPHRAQRQKRQGQDRRQRAADEADGGDVRIAAEQHV